MRVPTRVPSAGALVAALAMASVIPAACGGDGGDAPAAPPPIVAVHTVLPAVVTVERQWHGRLEPLRSYAVQAPRAGRVAALGVRDGDLVQAGAVLLRMESPDVDARRSVLHERVAQLQAELERWQRLADQNAAGPGEVAEARLRLLEARDQASQLDAFAGTYEVRAPASGRVALSTVGRGANVTEGQTLMQVQDASALGVRLMVPATETVYLEDAGQLRLQDDRGTLYPVDRVVLTSDAHPSFVRADLYVRGVPGFRSATVLYSTGTEVLSVPWTAVASDGDVHWVAVVVDGDPPRVERRPVQLGQAHAAGIEVRAGLQAGDRVVRYEPRSHPDGRAVTPHEPAREVAPASSQDSTQGQDAAMEQP
jgi:multidrug efflux pump subunit AcrA (membrane-fusion protein)